MQKSRNHFGIIDTVKLTVTAMIAWKNLDHWDDRGISEPYERQLKSKGHSQSDSYTLNKVTNTPILYHRDHSTPIFF